MFRGITGRLYLVKIVSVLTLVVTMGLTYNLWTGNRYFPLVNLFPFEIPVPYDIILPYLLATLGFLSIIYPAKRTLTAIFCAIAVLLVLFDLNRLQPWYYQIFLTLFIFLLSDKRIHDQLNLLKMLMAATYLWGGLHKLNPLYFDSIAPWFAEIPENLVTGDLDWLFYLVPFFELALGILMIFGSRKMIILPAFIFHLGVLFITGPLGHSYNSAVWPWNIAQLIIIPLLFGKEDIAVAGWLKDSFDKLRLVCLTLLIFLPALNLFGWWPAYMSFNLYSGTPGYGFLYLGSEAVRYTPIKLRELYLPEIDSTFKVNVGRWGLEELGVPPFPERVTYLEVQDRFLEYYSDSDQVVLGWVPRRLPWKEAEMEIR